MPPTKDLTVDYVAHLLAGLGGSSAAPAVKAARAAAVLIPLLDREGGCSVVLTRRASRMRHHAGEICLPGGRMEVQDQGSVVHAALRECEEELGVARTEVAALGVLPRCTTSSGLDVYPVVGVLPACRWVLQPQEVVEVLEVPLGFFLDAANYRWERRTYGGVEKDSLVMDYRGEVIWGLTARIMNGLREALQVGTAA